MFKATRAKIFNVLLCHNHWKGARQNPEIFCDSFLCLSKALKKLELHPDQVVGKLEHRWANPRSPTVDPSLRLGQIYLHPRRNSPLPKKNQSSFLHIVNVAAPFGLKLSEHPKKDHRTTPTSVFSAPSRLLSKRCNLNLKGVLCWFECYRVN